MITVDIKLKGVSPLLINRFKEQDEIPVTMKKRDKKDYGTPREQAEKTPYYDAGTKKLWIPCSWISGAILTVASDYKLTGSKKTLKSVSGGAIVPTEEKIYFCEGYKLKDIEIDSRPAVVNRARIMRHRARLENWSIHFQLGLEDEIISEEQLHELVADAGRRAGFGDYRPPKGGPFGRFQIVSWKKVDQKDS
jgi:hypothetical protein